MELKLIAKTSLLPQFCSLEQILFEQLTHDSKMAHSYKNDTRNTVNISCRPSEMKSR